MKNILKTILIVVLCTGCANMTPQQQAIAATATNLATIAVQAAATYYGGPAAGQLASSGLSALGSVIQSYVGNKIPANIVQASPGITGVGAALVTLVAPNHVVTQADADKVQLAASIAAQLKTAIVVPATP